MAWEFREIQGSSEESKGIQRSQGKPRGAQGSQGGNLGEPRGGTPSKQMAALGSPRELRGSQLRGAQGSPGEPRGAQGSPGELRGAQGSPGEPQVAHGAPADRTFFLVLGCIHYCKGTPCGEAEIAMEGMASSRRSSGYVRGNACTLGRSRSGKPLVWGFPYFRVQGLGFRGLGFRV